MDNKSNIDDNTDLALIGSNTLAKLIGITYPPATAIAPIIDIIRNRRDKKQLKRLIKLVQSLDRRLTRLEGNVPETPDIDLLDEIIAKSVSDEDEDKTELYAALVQYWMEHKSQLAPYEVRLLGNVIKELTVDEIEVFHGFITSKMYPTKKLPKQLDEIIWNRIVFLGLLADVAHLDARHPSNVTQIGQKLVKIYQLSITAK